MSKENSIIKTKYLLTIQEDRRLLSKHNKFLQSELTTKDTKIKAALNLLENLAALGMHERTRSKLEVIRKALTPETKD